MSNIPACRYCKHFFNRLTHTAPYPTFFIKLGQEYICLNNYIIKEDIINGNVKRFNSCQESRDTDKCQFKPTLWYNILKLFNKV